MASGTPILASKIGSINEIIDSNTAFLFDPTKSLTNSLKRAKYNQNLAFKKALSAKKKVEKFYSLSVRSNLLINFLKKTY